MKRIMGTLRIGFLAAFGCWMASGASAQNFVELIQDSTQYNFRSEIGVPLSSVAGSPEGSDGRIPLDPPAGETNLPPTANQFQGVFSIGGLVAPRTPANLDPNLSYAENAALIGLPQARTNNVPALILSSARVGSPILSRPISFQFGSVIPVPTTDENENPLGNILSSSYWQSEPHTINAHANAGYYYSPHAKTVFATQPGPIDIVWRKATPDIPPNNAEPAGYVANVTHFKDGPAYFRLFSQRYVVSGSAVKPPQQIYWTEGVFRKLGKPVTVPTGIRAVNFVYSNNFPKTVPTPFVAPGQSFITNPENLLQEVRTLWFDDTQSTILAYNKEGRVFVEFLGDSRPDQTQQHLGFEIVDVIKQANPEDITTEIGERLNAFIDGRNDSHLYPETVLQQGPTFVYQQPIPGRSQVSFFATRETTTKNDVLVHWLREGIEGIRWPSRFVRYQQVWPSDVSRYSHYIRPAVTTEAEAIATAVPLPHDNVPFIEYQDPLDRPRAKLTAKFEFYTFLDASHPAHRTLIRLTAGEYVRFERIFSWLDDGLKNQSIFNGTVAANLSSWDAANNRFNWQPGASIAPRLVTQTIDVGARLKAPDGELGAVGDYLAGHIRTQAGTSFHPGAYADPFVDGFETAKTGAIIPINSIPGDNSLEVWWFRKNSVDLTKGFIEFYWPSVIGNYTIQWPTNPREIVLASNDGSGGLGSLEATGRVYSQNNPALPGYNPNEEHALMLGGQVYALRDDLNKTTPADYSSDPFVLLEFIDTDARPSVTPFKVLREKPTEGIIFDYVAEAGQLLQAPMPLPLLAPPTENLGPGNLVNYNEETASNSGDLPLNWDPTRDSSPSNGPFTHYDRFTFRDRKEGFWIYRGLHTGLPVLDAGTYDNNSNQFVDLPNATAVVNQPFSVQVHVSRRPETLVMSTLDALPPGLSIQDLTILGVPTSEGVTTVLLDVTDTSDGSIATRSFTIDVVANGTATSQGPLVITSSNPFAGGLVSYNNRPPYLAQSPSPQNSFTMRFYYKTQEGFDWPGVSTPPAIGTIVPYLRPLDTNGNHLGDPAAKTTAALDIVYRPTWPAATPTLSPAQTLTVATAGLPAVRGQTSLEVLYQQSVAADFNTKSPSVRLHDPTREKYFDFASNSLSQVPAGIRTDLYQGLTYFPNLPPHLVERIFYDPARGANGYLVLRGSFKDELFGEKYVQLSVLGAADLVTVQELCPATDPDKTQWDEAVLGLSTSLETFHEDVNQPGTFIPAPTLTVSKDVSSLSEALSSNTAVDSYALSASGPGLGYVTLISGNGEAFTPAGDPVSLHVFQVGGRLHNGEVKVLASANPMNEFLTLQHTGDLGARTDEYEYDWRIAPPVDGLPNTITQSMTGWQPLASGMDIPRFTLGGGGIQSLIDNYVTMRYRPINPSHPLYAANPVDTDWSAWSRPALAEGWIKRVLAGINPFNQRVTDLFSNTVNTDGSILTQAGKRWEGAVALNLDSINQFGLIEIYETVLRRGKALSIDAGINFGPANDALLLAAGYLNDLYMIHGNEAFADASNPTIGIGTANQTYGDIATALFAFKGQTASLLEEELALLRGRDEFLLPGTEIGPVYNRLVWNYTRGINSGEVIYAINYDILDQDKDGVVGPADAAHLYPQGHGDAYGHYLTALKGYYSLLLDADFDWVPRIEAVTILGQPVSVDYQDERKFAASAAALARTGRQVFDSTWRQEYQSREGTGWKHMSKTRSSAKRTRNWGPDHWASRTTQGAYYNWMVGNAILPDVDPDPTHEGIQKVDRTTVPELQQLTIIADAVQTDLDNAAAGLTPLGFPENSIPFDLNPDTIVSSSRETHFEQIFDRASQALQNAVVAFDEAKDVTSLMRSEQDSLNDFQMSVLSSEHSFTNSLITIYGTPYPDDIGPGKTYRQGYTGPDLLHHMYVETTQQDFGGLVSLGTDVNSFKVDVQDFPAFWWDDALNLPVVALDTIVGSNSPSYTTNQFVEFNFGPHGFSKPSSWTGYRSSPGRLQQAASEVIMAHQNLLQSVEDAEGGKNFFDKQVLLYKTQVKNYNDIRAIEEGHLAAESIVITAQAAGEIFDDILDTSGALAEQAAETIIEFLPKSIIAGVAAGGDVTSPARGGIKTGFGAADAVLSGIASARNNIIIGLSTATEISIAADQFHRIAPKEWDSEQKDMVMSVLESLEDLKGAVYPINERLQLMDDAWRNYRALVAEGERLQVERQIARQRSAAVVQGYRTRDAAFRSFRNEKLDRYKSLFDLAADYTFMAAKAYDYETGQLGTAAGRSFINRIINSRALGVIVNGEPQFAGSDTGDPGLSSILAEMKDDWQTLKGRLGFNNPDAYGTTVSLRTERYRILPTADRDVAWTDILNQGMMANVLDDADVERYCLQIESSGGLPVPGIVLEFSTTIQEGLNLFGRPAAPGDHGFSPASFATKIFAVGAALEGYKGMDDPSANSAVVNMAGTSPGAANVTFLDPDALFATPYIYLIPVGDDTMRSPPLGDVSAVRTWTVNDVTIPMPFNIGASDFSSKQFWQESDSLTEPLFNTRKHQPFRPVSSATIFNNDVYGDDGIARSQFTNTRLIGRSVWNSKWKIVIPGRTLLNDPDEGLKRFIRTVKDIKLHFVTYSYSGN